MFTLSTWVCKQTKAPRTVESSTQAPSTKHIEARQTERERERYLDLDQLEILIFGHSAEHCLQVAGKRMGEERERRWRRRVGGEEQWPVASSGVVGK
jgi:hypothetical protein